MTKKTKLLVTGASGFLGWYLCQKMSNEFEVMATYYKNPLEVPCIKMQKLDILDVKTMKSIFSSFNPSIVIHLAAISQPNVCHKNPVLSRRINVEGTYHLASLCADLDIKLIFTSTDQVFDGKNPPYSENERVCPINYYGENKVDAERVIQRVHPNTVIYRLPLLFGYSHPGAKNFFKDFMQILHEGGTLKLFYDEIRTPVSGQTAAQSILFARNLKGGIYHLGGRKRISRYTMGCEMQKLSGLKKARIESCSQKEIRFPAPRPLDVSLDSSKAFSLGYTPPSFEADLQQALSI